MTYRLPRLRKSKVWQSSAQPVRKSIKGRIRWARVSKLAMRHLKLPRFLMEVQGSGFVHFGDDNRMQYFAYSGKNNKPYVSIGRVLIENGEVPREKMSVTAIKEWVASLNPRTR